MINLPNLLTVFRIALVPVFILFFLSADPWRSIMAAGIFLLAAATDLLDGYLARRWKQVTKLGKLLDPIADKLLVLSALILLVDFHRVQPWIAIVLIGREIAISGLRAIATADGIILPAEPTGKAKLFLQAVAIIFLILDFQSPFNFRWFGTVLLWVSMVLAVASAVQYAIQYGIRMQVKGTGG
jgi:CDP-diacylglycerol---glycerol-3-phosphate 3-phosphatidyltransferase